MGTEEIVGVKEKIEITRIKQTQTAHPPLTAHRSTTTQQIHLISAPPLIPAAKSSHGCLSFLRGDRWLTLRMIISLSLGGRAGR